MPNDERKQQAKKTLIIIDEYLQVFRKAYGAVGLLKAKSIASGNHKRAISSKTAMTGLSEWIDDLENGQAMCLSILEAKKVPIVVERKLKLVVNNTGGK